MVVGVLAATTLAVTVGACTSTTPTPVEADAAQVVASLGAVPIPTPNPAPPMPTAVPGHLQVLAMGNPVRVVMADGRTATITASGPDQTVTEPAPITAGVEPSTAATIRLSVQGETGTTTVAAADIVCRDDTGDTVHLTPVGPASTSSGPGGQARLELSGTFRSGAAQVTWQPDGHAVAIWDFNIELD